MRTITRSVGILAGVIIIMVAVLMLLDWNLFRGWVEDTASAKLGREVEIGDLDVDIGWTSQVSLKEVHVANPDWASDPNLARINELSFRVRLLPLLTGDIELPEISLRKGDFHFERDSQGRQSWDLQLGEEAADTESDDGPLIGQVNIMDTRFRLNDAVEQIQAQGRIETAQPKDGGDDTTKIEVSGTVNGDPLEASLVGGSIQMLRQSEVEYPFQLTVTTGDAEFQAQGQLSDPFELQGVNADVALEGPDLSRILPSLELPLPATPRYSISSHVIREGGIVKLDSLQGVVGDSDISGKLLVDLENEKPLLRGELISERLDFKDLAPLIGVPPERFKSKEGNDNAQVDNSKDADQKGEHENSDQEDDTNGSEQTGKAHTGKQGESEPGGRGVEKITQDGQTDSGGSIFPTRRLDPKPFRTANVDLKFKAKEINAPPSIPVTSIDTHVLLDNGRLQLKPFSIDVADGTSSGEIVIDAQKENPLSSVNLKFSGLDLTRFFQATEFVEEMGGRFQGFVDISGSGLSLAEIMSDVNGEAAVAMKDGSVSGLAVEAIGVDIVESLVLLVTDDARIPLNCGRIDFVSKEGVVKINQGLVDTTDSVIIATGSVNLQSETLDITLEARAKDFSILDLSAPVTIQGKLSDPDIGIGKLDSFPLFELGKQEDLDCGRLISGDITLIKKENSE